MRVLIDADMIAHEVGHLRETLKDDKGQPYIDELTGLEAKGDLLPLARVVDVAKGRLLSIVMGSQAGGWRAFLTRGRGYRHDLATIKPYKGHREDLARNNVDGVKAALADDLGAIWIDDGREADDAMATEAWQDLLTVGSQFGWSDDALRDHSVTVIASRDKDLDTVPGWHFKWWLKGGKDRAGNLVPEDLRQIEKGEAYWVTFIEACRNFYKQLLLGDTSDNIKGLYNIGVKSAWYTQLNDIGKNVEMAEFEDFEDAEMEMYEHVAEKYEKYYGPYYGPKFLRENGNLLHMQRYPGDRWLAPDERDEHYWFL
jgi:hypothetical protein